MTHSHVGGPALETHRRFLFAVAFDLPDKKAASPKTKPGEAVELNPRVLQPPESKYQPDSMLPLLGGSQPTPWLFSCF